MNGKGLKGLKCINSSPVTRPREKTIIHKITSSTGEKTKIDPFNTPFNCIETIVTANNVTR